MTFLNWFTGAFLGAGLIKLMDYVLNDYLERHKRNINELLSYVYEYSKIIELYRFYENYSGHVVYEENGQFKRHPSGQPVIEYTIAHVDETFKSAIKNITGADLDSAITEQLIKIRLNSFREIDLAHEIDPSGAIEKDFNQLYIIIKTGIDSLLTKARKLDKYDPTTSVIFWEICNTFEEASALRSKLHNDINRCNLPFYKLIKFKCYALQFKDRIIMKVRSLYKQGG